MRRLLLSLILLALALTASRLDAQATPAGARVDTLTITGGTADRPVRVYLLNTGARVALMPTGETVVADTLVLLTPATIRLPHDSFALDIVTTHAADEASITFSRASGDTLPRRRSTTTLSTPLRITRAYIDAPLMLSGAKLETKQIP